VKPYGSLTRDSGVVAYELGADFIRVQFRDHSVYLYTYTSTGARDIEQMKDLAVRGEGLTTFINTHVRKRYARKEG
jgi:hypothetical protein